MDNEYLYDLEKEWSEKQNKRDFGREILDTMSFQEARDLLTPLLETRIDLKREFNKKYKQIAHLAKRFYAPNTFAYDFAVKAIWILQAFNADFRNENELKEIERHWYFNEARKPIIKGYIARPTRQDFSLLIARAKQNPIERFCKNNLKRSGQNRLVTLCPFIEEKTPSFTIFINTNTFYCFGCNCKGDVIAFYQKLYGKTFIDAVNELSRY